MKKKLVNESLEELFEELNEMYQKEAEEINWEDIPKVPYEDKEQKSD